MEDDSSPPTSSSETNSTVRRRRPRGQGHRRAVSFTFPSSHQGQGHSRSTRSKHFEDRQCLSGDEGDSRRLSNPDLDALSPDLLERFVSNVQTKAGTLVTNVKDKAEILVHNVQNKAGDLVTEVQAKAGNAAHTAAEIVTSGVHHAEELAHDVLDLLKDWKACHFEKLPGFLKDNEYLHFGHRPELKSFQECFRSIFRIHTETGNIWTHLIGFVAFVVAMIIFYIQPLCTTCQLDIDLSEKLIFLCFFIGAIVCLAFSTIFHTVCCHSEWASTIFSRLDYAGIAVLIVGSIIPWLYYGFYCQFYEKLTYMVAIGVLGILTIVLTLWDRFNLPDYRAYRAGVFISLGCVSVIPVVHYLVLNGLNHDSLMSASIYTTLTVGALYITGALLYAARIPERFLPGKCDIWFQSHQIFHVFVIVAAFVHYHGISEMAIYRLRNQQCLTSTDIDLGSQVEVKGVGAVY